jgi:hypothetical protein
VTQCTAVMLSNLCLVSVVIDLRAHLKKPHNKMYSWIVNIAYILSNTNYFIFKNESLLHFHLCDWFHIGIRSRICSSEDWRQCVVKFGERKVNMTQVTQPRHNLQWHNVKPSAGSLLSRCLLLVCCHNSLLTLTVPGAVSQDLQPSYIQLILILYQKCLLGDSYHGNRTLENN